jgi:hypothetical protein
MGAFAAGLKRLFVFLLAAFPLSLKKFNDFEPFSSIKESHPLAGIVYQEAQAAAMLGGCSSEWKGCQNSDNLIFTIKGLARHPCF